MKIKIDLDRITLDDLIVFEEGSQNLRFTRDFLARFIVDDVTGEYLDEAQARAKIGKLTVPELQQFTGQINEAVKGAMADTIPPVRSGG